MNLKKFIFEISNDTDYEGLSSYSIYSILLHNISKSPYFKGSFNHLDLIESNNEFRIFSNFINNAHGFVNQTYNAIVMDEDINDQGIFLGVKNKEEDPEFNEIDSDDYYEYGYDEVSLDYNKTKLYISEDKLKQLQEVKELIINAKSFQSLVLDIEKNPELIKTLSQTIINNRYKIGSDFKDFYSLTKNMSLFNYQENYYKIQNKKRDLGSTNDRDIFHSNLVGRLMHKNEKDGLEFLKTQRLYEIMNLTRENNEYPKEIEDIYKEKENYTDEEAVLKCISLFYGENKKYNNPILNICLSDDTSEDKKWNLINYYFENKKDYILNDLNLFMKNVKSKNKLLESHDNILKKLEEKVHNEFPKLKNNKINKENLKIEVHEFDGANYDVANEKETLVSNKKYQIADESYVDNKMRGFCFGDLSSFKNNYISEKTFLIVLKSDDDVLAFGDYYIDKGRIRTNNINVGTQFRGNNLSSIIFEEIMNKSVELNLPLATTHYTISGETHLPSQKKKMLSKRDDVLWIDVGCYNDLQTKAEKMFADINDPLLRIIRDDYSMIPIKTIRVHYDKMIKKYDNELDKELSFDEKYSMKFKALNDMQEALKLEKEKLSNKKKSKFKPR